MDATLGLMLCFEDFEESTCCKVNIYISLSSHLYRCQPSRGISQHEPKSYILVSLHIRPTSHTLCYQLPRQTLYGIFHTSLYLSFICLELFLQFCNCPLRSGLELPFALFQWKCGDGLASWVEKLRRFNWLFNWLFNRFNWLFNRLFWHKGLLLCMYFWQGWLT